MFLLFRIFFLSRNLESIAMQILKVLLCCVNGQAIFFKCNRAALPHMRKLPSVPGMWADV